VVITATEELLSPEQAGERLGVSVYTVRRWIKEGRLRAFKPGKEYRIQATDLEEFLRAREVRPKAPRRSPYEPSLLNGLEEERRRQRTQLLQELEQHAGFLRDRFARDVARLEHVGSLEDWELLQRDAAFSSIGAHLMLEEEGAAREGSETERRAWRGAHEAVNALDALCDEIEGRAANRGEGRPVGELPRYRKRAS
jgi:excisionase family DNA binding protein